MSDELREQLADIQHAIWAHWMGYMFGCGEFRKDDTWVMPAEKLERWWRQKEAPYSELSDKERESDRHQADKILAVVQPALAAANARAEAAAWQDGGFCSQCGADRVRTSTDDIDAPMLHTLSYCVACGGFWIWDHEAQQSKVQP